jgi:hypothetical protein
MNRILFVFILISALSKTGSAQTSTPSGKPIMQIISDYHFSLNDTAKTSGFGISRAYFGYNYQADPNFSCEIVLNVGTPEDLPKPSTPKRYAFFREAAVTYSKDRLHISFGITTTRHFDMLQKFWGKRFICNEFEIRNKYGNIADLGVVADYRLSDKVSLDAALTNGEGYSQVQLDNGIKAAAGVTYRPDHNYVFRFYNDLNRNLGIMQYTASLFAGVDNKITNLGASFHYKTNYDNIHGHDAWGISATGALKLPRNFEIIGRYDFSGSIRVPGDSRTWNYLKDANLVIVGLEKNVSENCKLAIDLQDTIPYAKDLPTSAFIFINALFKI